MHSTYNMKNSVQYLPPKFFRFLNFKWKTVITNSMCPQMIITTIKMPMWTRFMAIFQTKETFSFFFHCFWLIFLYLVLFNLGGWNRGCDWVQFIAFYTCRRLLFFVELGPADFTIMSPENSEYHAGRIGYTPSVGRRY